jgi:hypothetical protein
MATPLNLPHSYTPLGGVLVLMALQALLYYSRLPGEVVCKWDLSGNPRRSMGKGGFFAMTWAMAAFMTAIAVTGGGFVALPIAGTLLLITIVNQYIIAANVGDGRLHSSFFIVLAGYILAAVFLAFKFLPHH